MTPQERADILARHRPCEKCGGADCDFCGVGWPCDAYRLGHDIDEEALARALLRQRSNALEALAERATPASDRWGWLAGALAARYREEGR